jgi:hypothetical protein
MPLAGALDIGPLLEGAPEVRLDDREVRVDDVDILQVIYEVSASELEALVPPALNPTLPPVVSFLVYLAKDSPYGPFSLVQVRLSARAGVRPRAYLVSACCDNAKAADALATSWGFRIQPADVLVRRRHDRIECQVVADRRSVLEMALVDPEPISGHDVQYPPGMHLARTRDDGGTKPCIVQVESEYQFRRADRGRPQLTAFDAEWWGDGRLVPLEPVSASFTACDVTIVPVRYLCNPDLPAHEGTVKVGAE